MPSYIATFSMNIKSIQFNSNSIPPTIKSQQIYQVLSLQHSPIRSKPKSPAVWFAKSFRNNEFIGLRSRTTGRNHSYHINFDSRLRLWLLIWFNCSPNWFNKKSNIDTQDIYFIIERGSYRNSFHAKPAIAINPNPVNKRTKTRTPPYKIMCLPHELPSTEKPKSKNPNHDQI